MVVQHTKGQGITHFKKCDQNKTKTKPKIAHGFALSTSTSLNFFEGHKKAFAMWLQFPFWLCSQTLLHEI